MAAGTAKVLVNEAALERSRSGQSADRSLVYAPSSYQSIRSCTDVGVEAFTLQSCQYVHGQFCLFLTR